MLNKYIVTLEVSKHEPFDNILPNGYVPTLMPECRLVTTEMSIEDVRKIYGVLSVEVQAKFN